MVYLVVVLFQLIQRIHFLVHGGRRVFELLWLVVDAYLLAVGLVVALSESPSSIKLSNEHIFIRLSAIATHSFVSERVILLYLGSIWGFLSKRSCLFIVKLSNRLALGGEQLVLNFVLLGCCEILDSVHGTYSHWECDLMLAVLRFLVLLLSLRNSTCASIHEDVIKVYVVLVVATDVLEEFWLVAWNFILRGLETLGVIPLVLRMTDSQLAIFWSLTHLATTYSSGTALIYCRYLLVHIGLYWVVVVLGWMAIEAWL